MSELAHGLGTEEVLGHPAITDSRTGLANKLHFQLVYRYLFGAGDRGMAFTVMLLSIGDTDQFEEDEEGLRTVAETLQQTTRTSDLVAHVDGNRFLVLLLGTNLPGARIAADRIEAAVRAVRPDAVSIGLAAFNSTTTDSAALLRSVESALAAAESSGGGVEMA